MASFRYWAKRQIRSTHAVDIEYTIEVDLQQLDGGLPIPVKAENIGLSGNVVTVLHRIDRIRPILTDLVQTVGGTPDNEDFDEFFSSVAAGEVFVFNDDADQNVIMASKAKPSKQGPYTTYSFSIRLLE